MKTATRVWLLPLIMLLVSSPCVAQSDLVAGWGDPARLVVRGAASFTDDRVKDELATDFQVLRSGHPSAPLAEYLAVLRKQTMAGYQHAGFPDVEVKVELDGENRQIVVQIHEGASYTAGDVRVIGAETLNAERLVKRLVEKYPPPGAIAAGFSKLDDASATGWVDKDGNDVKLKGPVWHPGDPAPFDVQTILTIRAHVEQALADLGYEFATFTVDVAPPEAAAATADLIVRISAEGPPAIVRDIRIAGNQKNSSDEILAYLDLQPGNVMTSERRTQLAHRLWRCGRFERSAMRTQRTEAGDGVQLNIDLVEYPHAPALTAEFSREEATLLKCRDWLARFGEGTQDLLFHVAWDAGELELVMSPQHGFLGSFRPQSEETKVAFDHAAVLSDQILGYYSALWQRKFVVPVPEQRVVASIDYDLVEERSDGKTFRFNLGLSVKSNDDHLPPVTCALRVTPVSAVALAHESDAQCTWENDVLTVASRKEILRIDGRSGQLLAIVMLGTDGREESRFDVLAGAFEQRVAQIENDTQQVVNEFNPERPVSSIASFVCRDDVVQFVAKYAKATDQLNSVKLNDALRALRVFVNHDLLGPLDAWWTEETEPNAKRFSIPSGQFDTANVGANQLVAAAAFFALPLIDKLFARETWPWTLCRESALFVVDKPRYLSVELAKLYASAESGPLCHLATARLLRVVGGGELSRRFAQRGLERLIAEDFRHDYRMLLDEDTGFGRCALRAAEILRELEDDELAALGDLFLQNPNAVLTFAIALRQAPPEKIRDALPAALDRLWDDGMRERIEWALRDLQAAP